MEDAKREVLQRWQKYKDDWDMVVGEFALYVYPFDHSDEITQ
jgi:hypothetical protein